MPFSLMLSPAIIMHQPKHTREFIPPEGVECPNSKGPHTNLKVIGSSLLCYSVGLVQKKNNMSKTYK